MGYLYRPKLRSGKPGHEGPLGSLSPEVLAEMGKEE